MFIKMKSLLEYFKNRPVAFLLPIGLLLVSVSFQNCGQSFETLKENEVTNFASSTLTPVPTAKVGASAEDFRTCRALQTSLYDCLELRSAAKGVLKQSDVTRCTLGTPTDLDVAMCLTKSSFPIFGYREPHQWDIDTCASRVGQNNIATCLDRNGILPPTVTSVVINNCISSVGLASVEKCLRRNLHIKSVIAISNADAILCGKVTEQPQNGLVMRTCLLDRQVIPDTLAQVDFDTCLTNAPTTLARCLRTNTLVPRIIMQANINLCLDAVGPTRVAACLEANGYLYDNLLPATTLQTAINTCVTNAGATGISRCLRTNNVLSRPVMQAHIAACNAAAGQANILTCLTANGLVNATGTAPNSRPNAVLTQADIDTCVTNVGLTNVSRCLSGAAQKLVMQPNQTHFTACHRFVGPMGIANCLNGSGILPATLTQNNINTCIAAVGITNVVNCLNGRGFL